MPDQEDYPTCETCDYWRETYTVDFDTGECTQGVTDTWYRPESEDIDGETNRAFGCILHSSLQDDE